MIYSKYIKRLIDIIISGTALVLLSPIFLTLAIIVRIKLGSPVIFCQARPGRNEKIFKMYKFRSMSDKKDEKGNLLPDAERMTSFGSTLRALSLDELPELVNIFKGDMSFVGPRPLLVKYLPLYSDEQKKRHDVRPGLTGLAQTNGRNAITWQQKFKYDTEYTKNISFILDVKIFFKTIGKVIKKDGISSAESVTTQEFRGNDYQD